MRIMMQEGVAQLTVNEASKILVAVACGKGGFTDEEGLRVVKWARKSRIDAALVNMLMDGEIVIVGTEEGNFVFRRSTAEEKETILAAGKGDKE